MVRGSFPFSTIPTDNSIEVTIKFSFDNVTASSLNHSAIRRMNGASRTLIWHLRIGPCVITWKFHEWNKLSKEYNQKWSLITYLSSVVVPTFLLEKVWNLVPCIWIEGNDATSLHQWVPCQTRFFRTYMVIEFVAHLPSHEIGARNWSTLRVKYSPPVLQVSIGWKWERFRNEMTWFIVELFVSLTM